nr:protein kinase C-binding protein 1 isoform X4 [Helicoverpa armigera]
MEESTEPHMETDVSSTTGDVPEMQEVTGSDGNVEMIIVVEKMDDEPSAHTDEQTEEQPTSVEEEITTVIISEEEPPQKETEIINSSVSSPTPIKSIVKTPQTSPVRIPQKSPANSPAKSPVKTILKSPVKILKSLTNSPVRSPAKSPTKDAEIVNSPSKIDTKETPEESTTHLPCITSPSPMEIQQEDAVDSSISEPSPIQAEDKPDTEKSPSKEVHKPDQKSPIKEQQPIESATKEPLLVDKTSVNGKVQSNSTNKIDDTNTINTTTANPADITIENSNDSQIETMSDLSEKEHKGISRELKSLINSAKESKIISECTQLTSKTRKSRSALDTSSSSLNSSLLEPNKIQDARRNSSNSQKSNCSEKSERIVLKRSMRSQNPEFVSKVKQFLNSVTGKGQKDSDDEEDEVESKEKPEQLEPARGTPPKVKKTEQTVVEKSNKLRMDPYCWRCHWAVEQQANEKLHPPMHCTVCPRSFHYKCLTGTERNKINVEKNWVCPECMIVLQAESSETRSPAMKKISLGMLCDLLKHALERMMDLNGVEPFMQAVDRAAFPDYDKYVVHPMDLSLMSQNIGEGLYGSTEAFLADAQWILHNSIIFNTCDMLSTVQSKLTAGARALVRSCRAEMGEIEACPECYAAAHARRPTWFTDVCTTPHILFWAKLKGFPYWPAKGMSVNSAGLVDVRFFGAHDRAWVPAKDCFLYSEKDPNNFRTKRQDIIDSMKEAEQHIRNISRKYGRFVYPPFKTQFDPSKMNEQLKMMIPTFEGEVRSLVKEKASPVVAKKKSRSNSKSSKSSFNDGLRLLSDSSDSDGEELKRLYDLLNKDSDVSESEDTSNVESRKMADGAEIAKMEDDDSTVDKEMEVDKPVVKAKDDAQSSSTTNSRKRRRSELEEAVITIIESSGVNSSSANEKRRKLDEQPTEEVKTDAAEPSSSKEDDKPNSDQPKETTEEATPTKTNDALTRVKENDPTSSTEKDKAQRVTPIRIALVTKEKRHTTRNSSSNKDTTAKIITPTKNKEQEKTTPLRPKSARIEKVEKTPNAKAEKLANKAEKTPVTKAEKVDKTPNSKAEKVEKTPNPKNEKVDKTPNDKPTKEGRSRSQKRRNSRSSRSTNSTSSTRSEKAEKKSEKNSEANPKDKKEKESSSKDTDMDKSKAENSPKPSELQSPKSVKERLQFDDDTTLAVLARETAKALVTTNNTGMPTISCVRSLSTTAQLTGVTITKTTTNANTIDITEEATSDSSIFTPTSTDNVNTMKDAVSKLQKLRSDAEPVVGRVGVRAFARMTSPERPANEEVQVEIKAEPIDLDDADRHMEKMDLMNAFRLRPVNPQNLPNSTMSLRDVRINKVVVTPLNAKKTPPKPEIRPRAKKTFPQPKKADEGRSELNSKNSMVYIPIQPPMTQAPLRLPRPQVPTPVVTAGPRPPPLVSNATTLQTNGNNNSLVNTVTTPLMQAVSTAATTCTTASSTSVATVPTVHTVPLMTSVNGQWMFSFQPVMSVGAIDSGASPPMLKGVAERGGAAALTSSTGAILPVTQAGPTPPISVYTRPTENTLGEPPRLQQRPAQFLLNPLDVSTPIGSMPTPSTAGPVTAKLNQNAVKMTDFFRTLIEDSIEKLEEPASQLTSLRLQLEQAQWQHKQEIVEVKHNHELTLAEMRASFEKEKQRAVSEARRAAQVELEAAVKLAKSKQWCANCSQEAQFYCCWNTSYCDYPCQRAHWSQHYSLCQQRSQDSNNGEPPKSPENRLQPQPEMPKSSAAPTLTVGGKLASRGCSQDPHSSQKASIIVSMVEDTSGNQTMKCVGTYKPPSTGQMPIIINKQIMNNEENANKKVVSSSGGYLIVGSTTNSSIVNPARRTHTIQYYT